MKAMQDQFEHLKPRLTPELPWGVINKHKACIGVFAQAIDAHLVARIGVTRPPVPLPQPKGRRRKYVPYVTHESIDELVVVGLEKGVVYSFSTYRRNGNHTNAAIKI